MAYHALRIYQIITLALPLLGQSMNAPETRLKALGIQIDAPSLVKALRNDDAGIRSMAAAALADIKDTAAISDISDALAHESEAGATESMAASLLRLGSEIGKKRLISLCSDSSPDEGTRMMAANALAAYGDYSCVPYILHKLSSKDVDERQTALLYLSHVPAKEASVLGLGPVLLAATNDTDAYLRNLAVSALFQVGDERSKRQWTEAHKQQ